MVKRFHSLITLKNVHIFKGIVKWETFFMLKDGLMALVECTKKYFLLLTFFGHFWTILA